MRCPGLRRLPFHNARVRALLQAPGASAILEAAGFRKTAYTEEAIGGGGQQQRECMALEPSIDYNVSVYSASARLLNDWSVSRARLQSLSQQPQPQGGAVSVYFTITMPVSSVKSHRGRQFSSLPL